MLFTNTSTVKKTLLNLINLITNLEPLLEIQKAFPQSYLKYNPLNLPNEDIKEYFTEDVYINLFDSLEEFIHDKQSYTYSGI